MELKEITFYIKTFLYKLFKRAKLIDFEEFVRNVFEKNFGGGIYLFYP